MEVAELTTLITTVGFPIVCAIGMGWFIYKCFFSITAANKERESRLYKIINDVRGELAKSIEINASFIKTLEIMDSNIQSLSDDVEEIKSHLKDDDI